jgi:CBS-domain-containing membrane protein
MSKVTVADVMTTDVVTVPPTAPFKEVARVLVSRGISAVPVVDEESTLLGVVSEADLLVAGTIGVMSNLGSRGGASASSVAVICVRLACCSSAVSTTSACTNDPTTPASGIAASASSTASATITASMRSHRRTSGFRRTPLRNRSHQRPMSATSPPWPDPTISRECR